MLDVTILLYYQLKPSLATKSKMHFITFYCFFPVDVAILMGHVSAISIMNALISVFQIFLKLSGFYDC